MTLPTFRVILVSWSTVRKFSLNNVADRHLNGLEIDLTVTLVTLSRSHTAAAWLVTWWSGWVWVATLATKQFCKLISNRKNIHWHIYNIKQSSTTHLTFIYENKISVDIKIHNIMVNEDYNLQSCLKPKAAHKNIYKWKQKILKADGKVSIWPQNGSIRANVLWMSHEIIYEEIETNRPTSSQSGS